MSKAPFERVTCSPYWSQKEKLEGCVNLAAGGVLDIHFIYVHSCLEKVAIRKVDEPGASTNTLNPSIWETEAGGSLCPRLTRTTHKALCLKDQQKVADSRLSLCLLYLSFCLTMVKGPWVRSDISLSRFCINVLEKWSLEGSESSAAVYHLPLTCRSHHGSCHLDPVGSLADC